MQKEYTSRFLVAVPGMFEGTGQGLILPYRNSATSTKETWTVTVPATVNANATYTLTISDVVQPPISVSVDTGATPPTTAQLRDQLVQQIKFNPVFNGLVSHSTGASTVLLTHRLPGRELTVSVSANANPLVAAKTTPATNPGWIDFGVAVTATSSEHARLPAAGDTTLAGFTVLTEHSQKSTVGSFVDTDIRTGYPPRDTMNVLRRCNDLRGMWVPTLETSFNITDPVYVNVTAEHEGWVQKTNANSAIDISAKSSLVEGVTKTFGNLSLVLIHFNF